MSPFELRTVVTVWIPAGIVALIVVAAAIGPTRPPAPDRVVVPIAEPVRARPVEGDPAMAEARRQPSAVVAGELVVPWSTIRRVVASAADEEASLLAEDLGDVVETLRRTRRNSGVGVPLPETLDDLARFEKRLLAEPRWARQPDVVSALGHHHAVLDRYAAAR